MRRVVTSHQTNATELVKQQRMNQRPKTMKPSLPPGQLSTYLPLSVLVYSSSSCYQQPAPHFDHLSLALVSASSLQPRRLLEDCCSPSQFQSWPCSGHHYSTIYSKKQFNQTEAPGSRHGTTQTRTNIWLITRNLWDGPSLARH